MKYVVSIAALLAVGALSACASPVYDGRLAWDDGWRKATVTDVLQGVAAANNASAQCPTAASPPPSADRYVTVKYPRGRQSAWYIRPVPSGLTLTTGDAVYINVRDCATPL